ncbi:hypothetical protein ENHAE0001_1099 [Enhydrobacter aerosaccus SK60]|nr:hypothetical protein ENHAE0001_1099 [Enhydrobacter aerosaccus SK60]
MLWVNLGRQIWAHDENSLNLPNSFIIVSIQTFITAKKMRIPL